MKKHQFEEITFGISLIICLMCYGLHIDWLFYFFAFKSVFDLIAAMYYAAKSAMKDKEE